MGKFKIGDKVTVTTLRFGSRQYGLVGEVFQTNYGTGGSLPIRVRFGDGTNSYADQDLVLGGLQYLPDPEFDLDEIERAERLVHD